MIALLCETPTTAARVAARFSKVRRTIDGPFHMWQGTAGTDVRCLAYAVGGGADAAYAAGRCAVRRGAEALVTLTLCEASREYLEDAGLEPGDVVMPAFVHDLRGAEPVQRLCGDSCSALPVPLAPGMLGTPLPTESARDGGRDAVGTMAFPLTVPLLAREIYRAGGIGLFDSMACGSQAAAREENLPGIVLAIIARPVLPGFRRADGGFAGEARLMAAVDGALNTIFADGKGFDPATEHSAT